MARLIGGGHAVMVIGRRGSLQVPGTGYRACDIMEKVAIRAEVERWR
ncbi:MAG: hypothetical protein NTU62_08560 [Spirochaetes bacterium]|nr:hypothetical protein [Spirochaetota bacterium]